jgi:hypothetical protein
MEIKMKDNKGKEMPAKPKDKGVDKGKKLPEKPQDEVLTKKQDVPVTTKDKVTPNNPMDGTGKDNG